MTIRWIFVPLVLAGCVSSTKPSDSDARRGVAQAGGGSELVGTWRSQTVRCASGLEPRFDKTNYDRLKVERVLIMTPQFVVRESHLDMKLKGLAVKRGSQELRSKIASLKKLKQDAQTSEEVSKLQSQLVFLKDLGRGKQCTNSESASYEMSGDEIRMKEFSQNRMGCISASPIFGNHNFSVKRSEAMLETVEVVIDDVDICPKTDKILTTYARQ